MCVPECVGEGLSRANQALCEARHAIAVLSALLYETCRQATIVYCEVSSCDETHDVLE